MCIAIYTPAGKVLSESTLRTCFKNNPDGAGFVYINTDDYGVSRMKIKKYMDFNSFYKQYRRAKYISPESPMLIHFRIGTHGVKTSFNCHPFWVKKRKMAFIHNGVISGVGFDTKKSDTQLFNEKVLQKLPKDFMKNEAILKLIEEFIGHSKIAILDIKGNVTIYNDKKGSWVDSIWYSNDSYKERTYPITTYSRFSGGYSRGNSKSIPYTHLGQFNVAPCDYCNKSYQLIKMSAFQTVSGNLVLCDKCKKDMLDSKIIKPSQKITMKDYIDEENINRQEAAIANSELEDAESAFGVNRYYEGCY